MHCDETRAKPRQDPHHAKRSLRVVGLVKNNDKVVFAQRSDFVLPRSCGAVNSSPNDMNIA
jgi:hypothetical protein